MAKETKAQRQAREEAEMQALYRQEFESYPERLMEVLQRACAVNFELTVRKGQFLVFDRDETRREKFWLTVDHTADSEDVLQSLNFEVDVKTKKQAEAKRKKWK